MQIIEHTSTKLVIYSRPLSLWTSTVILVLFGPVTLLLNSDLITQENQSLLPTIVFLVPWLVAAAWLILRNVQTLTSTFSKETNLLIQERHTILGLRVKNYPLSDIEDVLVIGDDGEGIPINPLDILLKSGSRIPVYLQLDFFKALPMARETAILLRQFLELEEE